MTEAELQQRLRRFILLTAVMLGVGMLVLQNTARRLEAISPRAAAGARGR